MELGGLQKLTLLDYPGQVACTVFTAGCNLRCPFCHNAGLVTRPVEAGLQQEGLLAFLKKRQGLLDGVCITGGEPLLHPDLPGLMQKIKDLGYRVKLDTNGTFPQKLQQILQDGLCDYVAMDIKNAPQRYGETVGVDGDTVLPAVQKSVELLLCGQVDYEFRTTLVAQLHSIEELYELGPWLQGARHYYLQRFVDSGDLIRPGLTQVPEDTAQAMVLAVQPYIPNTALRGY